MLVGTWGVVGVGVDRGGRVLWFGRLVGAVGADVLGGCFGGRCVWVSGLGVVADGRRVGRAVAWFAGAWAWGRVGVGGRRRCAGGVLLGGVGGSRGLGFGWVRWVRGGRRRGALCWGDVRAQGW